MTQAKNEETREFVCTGNVLHNGEKYKAGDPITLNAKNAKELFAVNAIKAKPEDEAAVAKAKAEAEAKAKAEAEKAKKSS